MGMKEREHGWPACDPAAMKAGGDQAVTPAVNGQDCKWKTMGKSCKLKGCLSGLWGGSVAQARWTGQDQKENTWPWWRYTPNATPAGIKQATEGNSIVDGALNHGNACAVHGGCSSYGPSGTMCRDAGCTCELRQVSTRAYEAMGYKPALQPTGFLSRLGAEGKDKDDAAHQVVMWFGTAGSEWREANVVKLQLSTKPRQENNLAKAAYPYTSLLSHRGKVFSLQVSYAPSPGAGLGLDMEELQFNSAKKSIERIPYARIQWPLIVKQRTNFLCNTYAGEEETLKMAAPMILHNEMYNSQVLLLNVRNIVYMYSPNGVAPSSNSALLNSAKAVTKDPVGVATTLTGLAHYDPSRTAATTQMVINREKLYVLSSIQVWETVDLSVQIPCGQLMGTLREQFQAWKVDGGSATESAKPLVNSSMPGTIPMGWKCSASKTVSEIAPDTHMKKYTVCCAGKVLSSCCVDTESVAKDSKLSAKELANRVAGNA